MGDHKRNSPGLVHPGGARPEPLTQTPVGSRVERLRPEDIAWCLPPWLDRGSLVVQGGDVGARLGGRGVALRPLQTWNGEGASGAHMRQGPEGEPPSQALGGQCRALRQQVTGWPGRGSGRMSDSGEMKDKTDGMQR